MKSPIPSVSRRKSTRPCILAASVVAVLCQVPAAEAASIVFAQAAGNWNTASAWSPAQVPGAADSAFVRAGRTVTVNSDVGSVVNVYLGATDASGAVVFNSGANLTVTGDFEVMRVGTFSNIGGTFTMSGGNLAVAGLLQVAAGGATTTGTSSGSATFSGGTFSGSVAVGGGSTSAATGVFNVTGNAAAISGSAFTVNARGQMNFIFGATGVTMLNYATGSASFAGASLFSIDGSAYTGAGGDIKLVDSSNLTWNVQSGNISITGFSGFTTQLITADNDVVLRLTAVPEPTVAELMGGLGLMCLGRRKRRAL